LISIELDSMRFDIDIIDVIWYNQTIDSFTPLPLIYLSKRSSSISVSFSDKISNQSKPKSQAAQYRLPLLFILKPD